MIRGASSATIIFLCVLFHHSHAPVPYPYPSSPHYPLPTPNAFPPLPPMQQQQSSDQPFVVEKKAHLHNHREYADDEEPARFQILDFNWNHVQVPYTVSSWLLLASIAKILFHVNKRFGESIPDSALLIVVGLILGYALKQFNVPDELYTMKSTAFFLYLLPPIIFDAGYFMPNRQLFENFDSVLLFAIVGTIWNTLAIGTTLMVLGWYNAFSVSFSAFEILLFAALISAVDPVAVIAVFEEIHVNEFLFVNVFGEALFNDGVTVVLYQMFRKFNAIGEKRLQPVDYIAGGLSFFVIALGGTLIGLLFALMVSLATRFSGRVKILAPVFVFVVPYMAYLTAEMWGLSSILAIVACGIAMKQYVKGNITHNAASSVKYFVKMLAQSSETIIFMFLGLSTMVEDHHFDLPFLVTTVVICLVYRTIGVIVQCAVLNRYRNKKFSAVDQFVLSYGGLRGAIAFGLVVSMPNNIPAKQMFITTCIAVIYFTVFLQGITIRPLLHWLKVERSQEKQEKMIETVYNRYCDFTMTALEDIAGLTGRNSIRDAYERFNSKVLKPLLMKHTERETFDATPIIRAYAKITLYEAMQLTAKSHSIKIPKGLRRKSRSSGRNQNKVAPMNGFSPPTPSATIHSYYRSAPDSHQIPRRQMTLEQLAIDVSPLALHSHDSDKNKLAITTGSEDSSGAGSEVASSSAATTTHRHHPGGEMVDSYMSSQENTQALYSLFSQLLDRKIAELQAAATASGGGGGGLKTTAEQQEAAATAAAAAVVEELGNAQEEDDIKDDYVGQILGGGDNRGKANEASRRASAAHIMANVNIKGNAMAEKRKVTASENFHQAASASSRDQQQAEGEGPRRRFSHTIELKGSSSTSSSVEAYEEGDDVEKKGEDGKGDDNPA